MLRNFFKVSIRNLIRNKTYSFINIMGLSIGMACSILIFLFIIDELSYDKYHNNSENIYRIGIDANLNGTKLQAYVTGAPVGRTFVNEIPEVINSTRVVLMQIDVSEATVKYDEKKFIEDGLFYVDSTYLDIFTVEFVKGDCKQVLKSPNTIVITESIAKKYFEDKEPVGKALNIQGTEYLIEGIIKDCPANSHFHYTILASMAGTPIAELETWMSNDFSFTYLMLDKNIDIEAIKDKMFDVAKKYIEPEVQAVFGANFEDFVSAGNYFGYILQPVTDIHLKSHTDYEIEANSNIVYVYIFSIIAVFILFIAIINFMNLSTARSATRAKEVGIRKVLGASRKSLFKQFLFESIIMSIISLIVGMVIIESVLPYFNSFTLKDLSIGYLSNIYVLPALALLAVVVGLISGLYSAGYLSSAKILNVIQGKALSGTKHSWFRSFLVIFQFSISVTLFICTFVIYNQLNLLRNKDIGFEKKNIVVIEKVDEIMNSFNSFKQELESNPAIEKVTFSNTLPARMFGGLPCAIEGDATNKPYAPRMLAVDHDFAETYELKMKEGRFFSEDLRTDSFSVVLNEAAVNEFKFEEPVVGKRLVTNYYGEVYTWNIIGVVKDFNFRSLHQDVASLIITSPVVNEPNLISVKLKTGISNEMLKFIHEKWDKFVTETPFDYYIMEDDYDNLHSEEFRTGDVFIIFSILAIFIACLGLFGLASFMAENKTKEIGIRRAMGASVYKIVRILLTEFTKWVLWANIIAWPLAYFFLKKWLMNFAYQVEIKWWIFIASGILGLLIAVITVSSQAIKAATANPVNSLRYE
ncbi:ABC transporter permease [Bacteroidota bacterium]